MSERTQKLIPKYMKFVLGGSAGMMATCVVQPLDLVKTRLQVSGEGGTAKVYDSTSHAIRTIVRQEGALKLYTGLSAALLRQATYTTARLGIYTSLFEYVSSRSQSGGPPSFLAKMCIGLTAGVLGSFVGTPTEVCLIRMTADGKLPATQRRNYTNVFNALYRIYKEEGLFALWRGALPTMGRAAVVNVAQLVSYSQFKQILLESELMQDGFGLHLTASMCSALITTIASLPVDIAKTRIQNMRTINGRPEYSGIFDVLSRTVKSEGVTALWKGFTPYLFRIGPHTVLTFIILEQLNNLYNVHVLGNKPYGAKSGL
ncbi:Mitochondrial 2-oxoglutarate/malate carrier protein [Echinococcus granulosus]|uniref:Mitochondrial 2-oxoglutarate/malate carrier protein n=2 Tax=Echinococcus granulosus TaxID=6210 RepID=A0A068WVP1_ECHGR|nr:Mitochondrial 2-oxoglutarate/malate carrier protein [Echinococcus granulosus]CDS23875.1 mitochondrial 2 oxoglutarate:malate carrier [Echinococcus granulosus]